AKTFAQGDRARLQRLALMAGAGTLALTLPLAVILFFFPGYVLEAAFGSDYVAGAAAMSVIVLGRVAAACFGCIDTLMPMTGNERASALSLAASAALNVLLHATLVPTLGLVGA